MIRKLTVLVIACAASACYPLRNARIIDGTENEKGPKAVWVCVPEKDEPLNAGGFECARMDHAMGVDLDQPASKTITQ